MVTWQLEPIAPVNSVAMADVALQQWPMLCCSSALQRWRSVHCRATMATMVVVALQRAAKVEAML
jgi:hypothetical protein